MKFLSFTNEVKDFLGIVQQLIVRLNLLFFSLVDLLHGCFDESLSKPCQIMNWAIKQEFLDEILVCEGLNEPKA